MRSTLSETGAACKMREVTSRHRVRHLSSRQVSQIDAAWQSVDERVRLGRSGPSASINALGNRWTTVFDAANETVARMDPLSNRNTSIFDLAGRAIATVDPLSLRVTSILDAASQTKATVNCARFPALRSRTTSPANGTGRPMPTTT